MELVGEPPIIDPYLILLEFINGLLSRLEVIVQNQVGGLLADVGGSLSRITDQIGSNLSRLAGNIGDVVSAIAKDLMGTISDTISPILSTIRDLVDTAKNALGRIVDDIGATVGKLWTKIVGTATAVFDTVRNAADGVFQTVLGWAQTALATVQGWIVQVYDAVKTVVGAGLNYLKDLYNNLSKGIGNIVSETAKTIGYWVEKTTALINAAWRQLVDGTESIIAGLEKRLGDLKSAFADAAADLVDGLGVLTEDGLQPIKGALDDLTKRLFEWASPTDVEEYLEQIKGAFAPHSLSAATREEAYLWFQTLMPRNPVGKAVFGLVMSLGVVGALFGEISGACGSVVAQEWKATYLPSILAPAESLTAWRRGAMTEDALTKNLARHGYDLTAVGQLREATAQSLTGFEVCAAWRRGTIGEERRDQLLRAAGYEPDDAATFVSLTEVLPSVSDLVTFAVREVFSPEQAAKLGINQDFPPEFAREAAKQGLSEANARRYWAAHWQLPSPTQAYEMLHRGLIGETEVDDLLKAADYSPTWRENLRKIAYRPLTRVDIRRMHKTSVLKDEDLLKAYMDLGYDAENARRLADFTIALNRPASQESADELGRLTRTNILGFYRDRLLTPDRAVALLVESGLTGEAATLFVQAVDLDEQRKDRAEEATLTIDLATSGAISESEAQDRLRRTGLEESETQMYLLKLERALERKTKLPSRAEALQMVQAGVIDLSAYADLLTRLGYAEQWVRAFVSLAQKGD